MTMRADALAYLSPQGTEPIAHPDLGEYVDVVNTTAAPPFFTSSELIINGNDKFDGVRKFRRKIESQPQLHVIENANDLDYLEQNPNKAGIMLGLHQAPYDFTESGLDELYSEGVRILQIAGLTTQPVWERLPRQRSRVDPSRKGVDIQNK